MTRRILLWIPATILALATPTLGWAHCDTLDGPVVTDARTALESGDLTPVLKWVKASDEDDVRAAFSRARTVRDLGADARVLADTFFFETLVRIHRAGEGAPFAGLKPAGEVDPALAAADEALATGSAERLSAGIARQVAEGIDERFRRAASARENVSDSVEAGRAFVAAYVDFIHYVEGVHEAATVATSHAEN